MSIITIIMSICYGKKMLGQIQPFRSNTTLKPVLENLEKHVLFVDNLTAQQTDDFKKAVSDLRKVVWY